MNIANVFSGIVISICATCRSESLPSKAELKGYGLRSRVLLFIFMIATFASCQTSNVRDTDLKRFPPSQWATFDADAPLVGNLNDFHRIYRVPTLDGYSLTESGKARVKNKQINCLLRDCRLYPGQHSIDVIYSWSSLEEENKRIRKEAFEIFWSLLATLGGEVAGNTDGDDRSYPCHASLSFEAHADRDYGINITHTSQASAPEEFRIVDTESGEVVARAVPSC